VVSRLGQADLSLLVRGIVAIQLADLTTFAAAVRRVGIDQESNAVARQLFAVAGDFGPVLLKVAATLTILLILRRIARRFPDRAPLAAWVAISVGLVGALSNVVVGLLA